METTIATINRVKELVSKSMYIKREWRDVEGLEWDLPKYAEQIDPLMGHISDNPTIISKSRKDGKGSFLKMWIPLGESGAEFDLSYQRSSDDYNGPIYEEGDEIDKETLVFRVESFLNEEDHLYVTGEVL